MSKDKILTSLAIHLKRWPREKDGEDVFRIANRQASIITAVSVDAEDGRTRVYVGDHQFTEWQWHMRRQEMALDGWEEGEERIDRIAQSDASGDHYGEDSDGESALSQALSTPSKYHVRLKGAWCDVYDVLLAFGVTNPADQHAIKKMLMPGKRGHKDGIQDRREAIQSLHRAIELEDGQ